MTKNKSLSKRKQELLLKELFDYLFTCADWIYEQGIKITEDSQVLGTHKEILNEVRLKVRGQQLGKMERKLYQVGKQIVTQSTKFRRSYLLLAKKYKMLQEHQFKQAEREKDN